MNELIDRCPDDSEDTTFVFLKYVAYLNLCSISSEADAVNYIEKAEQLLPRLVKPSLFYILLPYFQLSPSIVSKREKNEKLILIKSLKGIGSEFYNLLEKLYATGCISDLSQCNADVASLVYFIDKALYLLSWSSFTLNSIFSDFYLREMP